MQLIRDKAIKVKEINIFYKCDASAGDKVAKVGGRTFLQTTFSCDRLS